MRALRFAAAAVIGYLAARRFASVPTPAQERIARILADEIEGRRRGRAAQLRRGVREFEPSAVVVAVPDALDSLGVQPGEWYELRKVERGGANL